MPRASVNGVELYFEEAGSGFPLVFVHEFAGDMRAWEPQVRYFGHRYRVIVYNQRGYPPSSVPPDEAAYSHDQLVEDLHQLLRHLKIGQAHIGGLATGGTVALNFGIRHPEMVRSLIVAGAGAGTVNRENWLAGARRFADDIARDGTAGIVANVADAQQRKIFRVKDPRGWDQFIAGMKALSPIGCEHMMRNALMKRTPVFDLETELANLACPTLVVVGDQDEPAFAPSRFICRHAPHAGLLVLPMCGHTLNSEEPDLFNQLAGEFLAAIDAGRWGAWHA